MAITVSIEAFQLQREGEVDYTLLSQKSPQITDHNQLPIHSCKDGKSFGVVSSNLQNVKLGQAKRPDKLQGDKLQGK